MSEPQVGKPRKRIHHHIARYWIYVGIVIVIMALTFSVFRALTPWARQYKPLVEQHLSALLEQPVKIDSMQTSWYWFQPVLRLNRVTLNDNQGHSLKLKRVLIGINVFGSLWNWKLQPGILYLSRAHFVIHQVDKHWEVEGLNLNAKDSNFNLDTYLPLLLGLSAQDKIIIRHVSFLIYLKDGTTLPLTELNASIKNWGGDFRIKGIIQLIQKVPTKISVSAELFLDPAHFNKTKGRVYFSIHDFEPVQWQQYWPNSSVKIQNGKGDITLWLDIKKGQLAEGQSDLNFQNIIIRRQQTPQQPSKRQSIDLLKANLGWQRTKQGWELEGDHIQFNFDQVQWPENAFFVHYNRSAQSYRVFAKHLLLKSLFAMDLPWPEAMSPLLVRKPKGELYDTEINLRENTIDYLLTGFQNLGWRAVDKIPSVQNLSGVLYWQPHEGRLELDSYNTKIKPFGLPSVIFAQINTAIEWKPLDKGKRIQLENLVLQHPDLTLTANGILEAPNGFGTSTIHLNSQFRANEAEHWIQYIPSGLLKPKLDQWLKHDIKQIAHLNGTLKMEGGVADFPFDHSNGEFLIRSDLSGVELYITPKWPLTRAIDGLLTFDKRNLNVDIHHAEFDEIATTNMNLRIDDIGLDYEKLLIHGKIEAPGQKILNYIFETPLKNRLSGLKPLSLQGLLGLDLNIEVPLYPQNDEVLTRGEVVLNHNVARIEQDSILLTLSDMTGIVKFDEKGIIKSTIQSIFANSPLSLELQSIKKPQPATQIALKMNPSMSALRKTLSLPFLECIKGKPYLEGILTLTNNSSDYDNLTLRSSLKGVQVNLPYPLSKTSDASRPFTASINFHPQKPLSVKLTYGEQEDAFTVQAMRINSKEWSLDIKQRDIVGNVRYQLSSKSLTGNISRLHLPKAEWTSSTFHRNSLHPETMPNLNLTINHLIYDDVDMGEISLQTRSAKSTWVIESATLKSDFYQANLKGHWTKENAFDKTEINVNVATTNLKKSLRHWHIETAVQAKKGQVSFVGSWPGFVADFALPKVSGKMEVLFQDGRISDLSRATEEKLGLGKLLSILSLQTIPRRLKLDFSDLSHKGYSFDQFKGTFAIKNGIMNTQNSAMDGPVASITMNGSIDLVRRRYDLTIFVSPHVMASLPVVATIVPATIAGGPIGPIAGVAAWAASKIINKVMYKVTGYTYQVTGPWLSPTIKQGDIVKKPESNS